VVISPLRDGLVVIEETLRDREERRVLRLPRDTKQALRPRVLVVLGHRQAVRLEQCDEPVPDRRFLETARETLELLRRRGEVVKVPALLQAREELELAELCGLEP
jgi:hypothetical protein